jgi:hypothetical protein
MPRGGAQNHNRGRNQHPKLTKPSSLPFDIVGYRGVPRARLSAQILGAGVQRESRSQAPAPSWGRPGDGTCPRAPEPLPRQPGGKWGRQTICQHRHRRACMGGRSSVMTTRSCLSSFYSSGATGVGVASLCPRGNPSTSQLTPRAVPSISPSSGSASTPRIAPNSHMRLPAGATREDHEETAAL